jgi:hypothetical protein
MEKPAERVLTDKNLLHTIASFLKRSPCLEHIICDQNPQRCAENEKCKYHLKCIPIQWGKFTDGDSLATLGLLDPLKTFKDVLHFTHRAMDKAAKYNHLEVIKWLHENRSEGCTTEAMDSACRNRHLEVVKWLHFNRSEGCTYRALAMNWAASDGYLEVAKWLHENRTEVWTTSSVMDGAARSGHLEVVKWLHENRTEGCTTSAMNWAASNGHLEVVKWLHENRTEGCTTFALDWAARGGHTEVVKWLYKNRKELKSLPCGWWKDVHSRPENFPEICRNLYWN